MRPIVLAALAISDGLDVPTLVSHGHKILKGLMEKNICILSYACDGTATERSTSKQRAGKANSFREYAIAKDSTDPFATHVKFQTPLFQRTTYYIRSRFKALAENISDQPFLWGVVASSCGLGLQDGNGDGIRYE